MATVVRNSSVVNECILMGDEQGLLIVEFRKWANFFQEQGWKTIPKILSYYHFEFDRDFPGTVLCKKTLHDASTSYTIGLLDEVALPISDSIFDEVWTGMSPERQQELFNDLREYCSPETQDILCLEPKKPLPKKKRGRPKLREVTNKDDPEPVADGEPQE